MDANKMGIDDASVKTEPRSRFEIYYDRAPSEKLEDAFCSHETGVMKCICGRVHFSSNGGFDFGEGELEALEKGAEEDPEKYLDWGEVSVGVIHFGKYDFVMQCACGSLRDFAWDIRKGVVQHYPRMADKDAL